MDIDRYIHGRHDLAAVTLEVHPISVSMHMYINIYVNI